MTIDELIERLEEYRDAARYSERRFGLGVEFVNAVRHATAEISRSPGRFQPVRNDVRIYRLRRFPFHLFYHWNESSESIIIYAVAHHSRRPDYWRNRFQR